MYDMRNLKNLKILAQYAPDAMAAYNQLGHAAFADGALSVKHKELIALAVAVATRCPYDIESHARKAREAGAVEAELAEAVMVSVAVQAGAGAAHAAHAFIPAG